MDRQYMPYWQGSEPGQYPPVKEEPDYLKMGYEDTPGGGFSNIKREPGVGQEAPPMGYAANVKVEPQEVKQEFVTPKQEPSEERRGEKRHAPIQFGPPDSKRYRPEMSSEHNDDDPDYDKEAVILDWYNSDLSLVINKENFLSAEPMTADGFAYVWHGVRSTFGFQRGRVFYEVKIEDHLDVSHIEEEQHPHVMRFGWSIDDAGLTLGEEPYSYGYGGTAKASTDLKFKDYGRTFGKGDVVSCFLDMDAEPIVMSFSVNGRNFGTCYTVSHRALQGKALFPHILTKNCSFKVNFGSEYPWFEPQASYTFVGHIPLQERVMGTQGPQTRQESEAIMMVGLPASGKTTWAEKHCKENLQKKYYVLGTNFLIDKMKVSGIPRKRNYHGRWDVLIEKCTKCLNKLLGVSYQRKRNYIIDQTNVYPSARKRKMKGFPGFYRKAVVICPSDAELQKRTEKQIRQEGKNVPDSAIMEMKANFTVPEVDEEIFDEVFFAELEKDEATTLIDQYSRDAQSAGFVKKPFRGGGRGGGFRGGWNRDRNSNNNRGGGDGFGGGNRESDQGRESFRGGRGGYGRGDGGGRGNFGGGGRGFDRGGGGRGGFDRGGGRGGSFDRGSGRGGSFDRGGGRGGSFDRGGGRGGFDRDSNRGFFTQSFSSGGGSEDNRGGGFGRGGNRGGYDRDGDGSRGGSFGRGSFGNRDGGSRGRGHSSYSDNSQGFKRDNDRDGSRGYGNDRSDDGGGGGGGRGRFGQDNFRSRDTPSRFDRDNRSFNRGSGDGSAGSFGQDNFGGNRDMSRGPPSMERGERDFGHAGGNSRGGYGRSSYGGNNRDMDRGYGQDNSGGDSQNQDRDYGRGGSRGSNNFGGYSNRSFSADRERDSRGDSDYSGGGGGSAYGGNNRDMSRGYGSQDSLSRNMGNNQWGGNSSYSNQDQSDSSGYNSMSSSSGSLNNYQQSYGGNSGNSWNRSYNQQSQQYSDQGDGGGYGNQQSYGGGRSFDRSSSSSGGGGGGGGGSRWSQQGEGGGGNQFSYGSGYQRQ